MSTPQRILANGEASCVSRIGVCLLSVSLGRSQREGESFSEFLSRRSIETFQNQVASRVAANQWLAEHDRRVKAEAWDEGHGTSCDGVTSTLDGCERHNPYRKEE